MWPQARSGRCPRQACFLLCFTHVPPPSPPAQAHQDRLTNSREIVWIWCFQLVKNTLYLLYHLFGQHIFYTVCPCTVWEPPSVSGQESSPYSVSCLPGRAGGGLPNTSRQRTLAKGHQWSTWYHLLSNDNWLLNIWRCSIKDDKCMLTRLSISGILMTAH